MAAANDASRKQFADSRGRAPVPPIDEEGALPVGVDVDEQLDRKGESEEDVEPVVEVPQARLRPARQRHLRVVLRVEDADEEVLSRRRGGTVGGWGVGIQSARPDTGAIGPTRVQKAVANRKSI